MAHIHGVYDTDTHFKIDDITRTIKDLSTTKTSVVQHDHNSERITFELPRYIDGHDMSTCNIVQIHYLNVDGRNKENKIKGVYEVGDLQVSFEADDVVIFSWLISGNATQLVGSLNFVVRFVCASEENTVDYAWNTAVYAGIAVSEGMYNGEVIVEEYADVLSQWKLDMDEMFRNGISTIEAAAAAAQTAEDNAKAAAESAANSAANAKQNVDDALRQAKDNGEFDGVTPHIGANGNWYIGNTDTGIPATGPAYTLNDTDKNTIAEAVKASLKPADIGAAASSHNQAASTITAGTFAGQVVANASGQGQYDTCLRNSVLFNVDDMVMIGSYQLENMANGEIIWTYE